jgi:HD-like signal output (HDOD) protein
MYSRETIPSSIGATLEKPVADINSLIKIKLPPLNRTVLRISELLRDENVSTKQLAATR